MTLRHYLMTAARRGPEYPLDASRRRIALCRGVTARSLAAQDGDWTWLVYVHPEDPLLEERLDAFRAAGHPVIPIEDNADAERVIDWSGPVLTTRIDDDDAFAAGAFRRLYRAVEPQTRTALLFPMGHHVRDGRIALNRHLRNAWSSLYAPAGVREHIRQVQHQRVPARYPVRFLDEAPGWLRVSHPDNNRPTSHRPQGRITASIRAIYPVDWDLLAPRLAA